MEGEHMNDRKPVIIAIAVGSLALAANGAAAMIAISASSAPPQAAIFGIIGLAAAFGGLLATVIWAFRDEPAPSIRHQRVFTPWSERSDVIEEFVPVAAPAGRSSLALARLAAKPMPVAAHAIESDAQVIYIADWLKAHGGALVDA
jgi:hypothetical protein